MFKKISLLFSFIAIVFYLNAQTITIDGFGVYNCDGLGNNKVQFPVNTTPALTPTYNWKVYVNGTLSASGTATGTQVINATGTSIINGDDVQIVLTGTGIYSGHNDTKTYTNISSITTYTTPNLALSITPTSGSICAGSTVILSTTTTTSGVNSTYTWYNGGTQVQTGSTLTYGASTVGNYTVIESNACGTAPTSNIVTITAGSPPAAPSIGSPSTTICDGGSVTLTASGAGGTYTWSNAATGTTTNISTAGSYYATETNSCGTSPQSNTIVLTALSTPIVSAITGTTNVCPGATTQLADVTNSGVWSTLDAAKATINATGLVTGVASGSVTIKYAVTNVCGTGFSTSSITVNQAPATAPSINSPKTLLCNGESVIITSSVPNGGGTIIWSDGDNGTTTSVSAAGSYKAYEINSCGNSPYSNIISITTLLNPSVAAITGNADVCVGSQLQLSDLTGGGAWSSLDNGTATINSSGLVTGISGTNAVNIQYAATNTCGTTTVSKSITVHALPVLSPINGLNNICTNNVYSYTNAQIGGLWAVSNATVTSVNNSGQVTTTSFGTSTLTYTYTDANTCTSAVTLGLTINALPIVNISSAIVGANVELTGTGASIYSWSSGETVTTISKVLNISNIYAVTGTDGNGCQSTKSFTVDAAPNASSTAITSTLGSIFCTNASTNLTLSAGNGYYWDSGENTISITTPNIGTHTGYVLYSVNYKVEAANIVLSNYPVPTVTPINGTNSIAYCNTATTTILTFTGSVVSSTYSWTNDNTTIGVLASGTNSISSFTASNTTNLPITSNFNVTPIANGCIGTPYQFALVVNPTPNMLTTRSYAICNITSNPITLTSNVVGANYQWTRTSNVNIQNATISSTSSLISEILNNISNDNTTATYSITTSANGCSTNATINVLVHPSVSADQLPTLSYCNGIEPGILTFTGWANGSTYSWTNDNTTIGVLGAGTNTIPNYVATNLSGDAIQANISVTPTANGCTGPTMNFRIIVNPTPNLLTPLTDTICNKAANPIALTSNVNYATYFWTRTVTTSIQNGTVSSTTAIINETLNNTIHDDATALYTVVTSANNCSTTKVISVLVHPTVSVYSVADITYCNGASAPSLTLTGWANGSTYSWTNDNTTIGVLASGTNSITSYAATNITGDVVTANLAVTPTANGCTGPTMNFRIIVNPTPNLLTDKIFNVCDGAYFKYIPKTNVTSTYNVAWAMKKDTATNISPAPISGTIITQLHNSSNTIKQVQFFSTQTALGCSKIDTLNVSIIPNPFGKLVASSDTILSGKIDTFQFVTSDTIGRINTWNLGFGLPVFRTTSDKYTMDYYHNTDTINTITIGVNNRYGCYSVFMNTINILGTPAIIPAFDTIPTKLTDKDNWANTLLPVPFNDHLSFRYHLEKTEVATFAVYDTEGFPLYSTKVSLIKGNNEVAFPELWRMKKDKVYLFICNSESIHHEQLFYGVSHTINF